jgi:hypothetical protein
MGHIEREIVINRPADVVFDFVVGRRGRRQEQSIWASLQCYLEEQKMPPAPADEARGPAR